VRHLLVAAVAYAPASHAAGGDQPYRLWRRSRPAAVAYGCGAGAIGGQVN
jgi:hypothetical protein